MRKRERPGWGLDPTTRWLFLAMAIGGQDTWALPRPGHWQRSWVGKNRHAAIAQIRIWRALQQCRGGAINWDEPMQSDSSDGEEASTFLPREEETPTPTEPPFEESEDDDDDAQSDSDLLDSPFLSSFQREIHSIVRDYRQEVSETFQQLMEDILDVQEQGATFPSASPKKSLSIPDIESEDDDVDETDDQMGDSMEDDTDEEASEDELIRMTSRERDLRNRYRDHSMEQDDDDEIGKNRGDIGFIVGETDEEEEEVLFRLKDEDNRESLSDDAEPDIPVYISDESTSFLSDVDAEPPFSEESDLQSQTLSASVQVPSIEEDSARETSTPAGVQTSKKKRKKAKAKKSKRSNSVNDDTANQTGTSAIVSTIAVESGSIQAWKSLAVAVSLFAIAILLNIAFQILKKMLWNSPK